LQTVPFPNRYEDGGFNSPASDDLGALPDGGSKNSLNRAFAFCTCHDARPAKERRRSARPSRSGARKARGAASARPKSTACVSLEHEVLKMARTGDSRTKDEKSSKMKIPEEPSSGSRRSSRAIKPSPRSPSRQAAPTSKAPSASLPPLLDCYSVERTNSGAGVTPAEVQAFSRRTFSPAIAALRTPAGMASLFFAVLAFCFITATAAFMLACRQKYSMNRRLCASGSAFGRVDAASCAAMQRAT
jgi:hypothetical protein